MGMDAKVLIEAIEGACLRDADELRARSYSGRGMYGKDCVGVVIPGGVSSFTLAAAIALALVENDEESAQENVDDLSQLRVCEDNMGLDTIVYFPQVAWPAGESDEDEDEDDEHDCEGPSCCTPEPVAATG